jgi:glucan biosynthesis protein C
MVRPKSPGLRMSKSSLALTNLRGFTILIVVAFHAVLAYLGSQPASPAPFDSPPYHWKAFPILDPERWFGFDLFCASQYVYLMHFMFFLSGLFVWGILQRKGPKRFLYDRLLRLGLPFVIGVYVLMPLAHYPV